MSIIEKMDELQRVWGIFIADLKSNVPPQDAKNRLDLAIQTIMAREILEDRKKR